MDLTAETLVARARKAWIKARIKLMDGRRLPGVNVLQERRYSPAPITMCGVLQRIVNNRGLFVDSEIPVRVDRGRCRTAKAAGAKPGADLSYWASSAPRIESRAGLAQFETLATVRAERYDFERPIRLRVERNTTMLTAMGNGVSLLLSKDDPPSRAFGQFSTPRKGAMSRP